MRSKNSKSASRASPRPQRSFDRLLLPGTSGEVEARHYPVPGATRAVVWVGGIVGGYDSPARGLYPELARILKTNGVASLRVRLRRPVWVPGSVLDVRAAVRFLRHQGIQDIALVGHSIGSVIVMRAARAERRSVRALVSLASLDLGAASIDKLSRRCACLFLHGGRDAILPSWFSVRLHAKARGPKRLIVYPKAGHRLRESRAHVRREILAWLDDHLLARSAS